MDINKVKQAIIQMTDSDEIKEFRESYKGDIKSDDFKLKLEYLKAGIPKIYWNIEWDNCHIDESVKGLIKKYCGHFKGALEFGQGIIFTGQHGTGKTTLSCLIAKEAIRQGLTSVYISVSKIIDIISSGYNNETIKDNLDIVIEGVHILVLDDLGKEYKGVKNQLNTMVSLKFDSMMRERINRSLITIGSTNYSESELKAVYGDSVLSVIYGACKIIEVKGHDFRKIKGKTFWENLEKIK